MHLLKQTHFTEDFQEFTLSEVYTDIELSDKENDTIDKFLGSEHFKFSCLPKIAKTDKNHPYSHLRQLFEAKKLGIKDFQELSTDGLFGLLDDFSKDDDWGDDRIHFVRLLESFKGLFNNKFRNSKFYIISKDWLDNANDKLTNAESWIYIYYFLIIWINNAEKKLWVCEWTYL